MSKATELKTTTELVKEILQRFPDTRNSDNILYYRVLQHIGRENGVDLEQMPVLRFFVQFKDLKVFPAFETVRRTRQKTQQAFPELAACDTVEGHRMENENAYRDYARKHGA